MSTIAIIDYKIGNLLSVERALKHLGAEYILAKTPDDLQKADKVILPGVGAFKSCISALDAQGFIPALKDFAASNKPILGICVGMQMLFNKSYEFGEHEGLSLIDGEVIPIPPSTDQDAPYKIPHIGWSPLQINDPDNVLLKGIKNGTEVYFVHSFMAEPASQSVRTADTDYAGNIISAAINHGNIWGTQFHPEKSAEPGLQILRNFLTLTA